MLRNKIRYLILIASMGLLSILYNSNYMAIIFLVIAIMPFILLAILCYCYGKIKTELFSTTHVANKGDNLPVTVRLSNPTIFPVSCIKLYLTYRNAYTSETMRKTVTVSLDYRTKTSYVCNFNSEFAGNIIITLEGIRFFDYLKIFSLRRKFTKELKIAVLPSYYELTENEITLKSSQLIESDTYSPVRKGDDPSEVFEIREYREGDRLQRIHWKLSRKQNQLMIKEFSDPVNCSIVIFISLGVPKKESNLFYLDAILECALSLSYSFLIKQQLHYLSWFNKEHGVCKRVRITHEKDLYEAIDGLLQAYSYTEETEVLPSFAAEYPHEQYSDFFLITGEDFTPSVDTLSLIKATSKQIIYIENTEKVNDRAASDKEILLQYSDMGIELWPVDIASIRKGMEQLSMG